MIGIAKLYNNNNNNNIGHQVGVAFCRNKIPPFQSFHASQTKTKHESTSATAAALYRTKRGVQQHLDVLMDFILKCFYDIGN